MSTQRKHRNRLSRPESHGESSKAGHSPPTDVIVHVELGEGEDHLSGDDDGAGTSTSGDNDSLAEGMDPDGLAGTSGKVVKTLTPEALAAFQAARARTGIVYISRIPPGMQPPKVRHLMSAYGEVGRVYLQQEDAKRAYLRRKYTTTKKPHYTEGWVEFKNKQVARSVAAMLNAQPIGGKKGTRWKDDVWTMKYLPRFKWDMLTEQVAHEAAVHAAKLRMEVAQSKTEQQDYLKNVELARVLEKRAERKGRPVENKLKRTAPETRENQKRQKRAEAGPDNHGLDSMLESVL